MKDIHKRNVKKICRKKRPVFLYFFVVYADRWDHGKHFPFKISEIFSIDNVNWNSSTGIRIPVCSVVGPELKSFYFPVHALCFISNASKFGVLGLGPLKRQPLCCLWPLLNFLKISHGCFLDTKLLRAFSNSFETMNVLLIQFVQIVSQ